MDSHIIKLIQNTQNSDSKIAGESATQLALFLEKNQKKDINSNMLELYKANLGEDLFNIILRDNDIEEITHQLTEFVENNQKFIGSYFWILGKVNKISITETVLAVLNRYYNILDEWSLYQSVVALDNYSYDKTLPDTILNKIYGYLSNISKSNISPACDLANSIMLNLDKRL